MPAPRTDIDREAVAASVALKGIRATVRDTGVPLGTVQRIAKAARVAAPPTFTRTVTEPITSVRQSIQVDTAGCIKPAHQQISDEMARLGAESRLSAALYAQRTMKYAADVAQDAPEMALADAQNVKAVVGVAQGANVPGFEKQQEQSAATVVNIALLGLPPEPYDTPCIDVQNEPI